MRYIQNVKAVCPTALEQIKYPVFLSIDSPADYKNLWALVSNVLHQRGKYADCYVLWAEDLYKKLAENSHGYYVVDDPFTQGS